MEEENLSKFNESIELMPTSSSFFNDSVNVSSVLECCNSSTPTVGGLKRKLSIDESSPKLRRLERKHLAIDCDLFNLNGNEITVISTSKINTELSNAIAIIDNKTEIRTVPLKNHLLDFEDNGSSTSNSQSSVPSISLGLTVDADDFLLMSSSEEEDDGNLETYYHLLDSPKRAESEEGNVDTTLCHPELSKTVVVDAEESIKDDANGVNKIVTATETSIAETEDKNKKAKISALEAVMKASPDTHSNSTLNNSISCTTNKFESKRFVPRSSALKRYIRDFHDKQQQRYPAWLEKAKKSCSSQELISLMQTIYEPTLYNNRERFVLGSLSINNYRKALLYCGMNPNKIPPNVMPSDFYCTSPKNTYKRFAMQ